MTSLKAVYTSKTIAGVVHVELMYLNVIIMLIKWCFMYLKSASQKNVRCKDTQADKKFGPVVPYFWKEIQGIYRYINNFKW